jgi:hypothetical protein
VRRAIARRAIATYSDPGALVVDPVCTDPTLPVVLEAIRQSRHAAAVIGSDVDEFFEFNKRVSESRASGASSEAVLLRGDPPELPRLLATQGDRLLRRRRQLQPDLAVHPGGSADLIVTFLPAAPLPGHTGLGVDDLLGAAAVVLRPGGYLVAVTTTDDERDAGARDAGSETVGRCEGLGLRYWQHIVALLVPIAGGELQTARTRQPAVEPTTPLVVHQNVHVFRKPAATEANTGSEHTDARRAA